MRQLREDTHLIPNGEVRVYRRERSKRWQAAFVIDGHTIHIDSVGYSCVANTVLAEFWDNMVENTTNLLAIFQPRADIYVRRGEWQLRALFTNFLHCNECPLRREGQEPQPCPEIALAGPASVLMARFQNQKTE